MSDSILNLTRQFIAEQDGPFTWSDAVASVRASTGYQQLHKTALNVSCAFAYFLRIGEIERQDVDWKKNRTLYVKTDRFRKEVRTWTHGRKERIRQRADSRHSSKAGAF
jgi:hypothetical protein